MTDYTEAERLVLIAGMSAADGRHSVWARLPGAVESLAERGLVEISRREHVDGMVESVPVGLSLTGIIEARKLWEGQ
jgi:hypothetical protein